MKKTILLVSNISWSAYFREPLIRAFSNAGFEVHVAAMPDHYTPKLQNLPCMYHPIDFAPKGKNPLKELVTIKQLHRLIKEINPDVYLGFSIKPVLYGGMLCRILHVPYINNIPGLGEAFTGKIGFLRRIVITAYTISQKKIHRLFVQNQQSFDLFLQHNILPKEKITRLYGSGVDTEKFIPSPLPSNKNFAFLMCSRIIEKKGVHEYIEASKRIIKEFPHATCTLAGPSGDTTMGELSSHELEELLLDSGVHYIGEQSNIPELLKQYHCIVLPTYYNEGVPRILIEGAASGRLLIASENVGCTDIVINEHNGLLVQPKNIQDLVSAMKQMLSLDEASAQQQITNSQNLIKERFDNSFVINEYLKEVNQAIA